MNIVGRLRNNNYPDGEGDDVFALNFTAEEIDYPDSKADSEARRARQGSAQVQPEAGALSATKALLGCSTTANAQSKESTTA